MCRQGVVSRGHSEQLGKSGYNLEKGSFGEVQELSSSRRKISGKESTWFVLSAFRAQTHDRFRRLKKKKKGYLLVLLTRRHLFLRSVKDLMTLALLWKNPVSTPIYEDMEPDADF